MVENILKKTLSESEKIVYTFYKKNLTYKEIMNSLSIENPTFIDNAIQRIKRKIAKVEEIQLVFNEVKELLTEVKKNKKNEVNLFPVISEDKMVVDKIKNIDLGYYLFLTEIGNGFYHPKLTVHSFDDAFFNKKENLVLLLTEENKTKTYFNTETETNQPFFKEQKGTFEKVDLHYSQHHLYFLNQLKWFLTHSLENN